MGSSRWVSSFLMTAYLIIPMYLIKSAFLETFDLDIYLMACFEKNSRHRGWKSDWKSLVNSLSPLYIFLVPNIDSNLVISFMLTLDLTNFRSPVPKLTKMFLTFFFIDFFFMGFLWSDFFVVESFSSRSWCPKQNLSFLTPPSMNYSSWILQQVALSSTLGGICIFCISEATELSQLLMWDQLDRSSSSSSGT